MIGKLLKKVFLGADKIIETIGRKISRRQRLVLFILVFAGLAALAIYYIRHHTLAVLSPKGLIAEKQFHLIVFAAVLSLIVVIPVFVMLFAFSWKYRESNHKAPYTPDHDHSRTAETIWWGVPLVLILILSIVTWNSSHALDPFRQIDSDKQAVNIEVVALQWKWLFIYPDQNIATVNYLKIPEKTPINFQITSDAPMNSFWIPQLGGQVYAMSGMSTRLHLMADQTGTYQGSSANISGEGFSGMHFNAEAVSDEDFHSWIGDQQYNTNYLDSSSYAELAEPSLNNPLTTYHLLQENLYDNVVMKFMDPNSHDSTTEHRHSHTDYGAKP